MTILIRKNEQDGIDFCAVIKFVETVCKLMQVLFDFRVTIVCVGNDIVNAIIIKWFGRKRTKV